MSFDLKNVVAALRKKNKELDENLKSLNLDPKEVKVSVTSSRRYPDGNYRWTSATYKGIHIKGYLTDPRYPKMGYLELTGKKLEELVTAKMNLIGNVVNKVMSPEGDYYA